MYNKLSNLTVVKLLMNCNGWVKVMSTVKIVIYCVTQSVCDSIGWLTVPMNHGPWSSPAWRSTVRKVKNKCPGLKIRHPDCKASCVVDRFRKSLYQTRIDSLELFLVVVLSTTLSYKQTMAQKWINQDIKKYCYLTKSWRNKCFINDFIINYYKTKSISPWRPLKILWSMHIRLLFF